MPEIPQFRAGAQLRTGAARISPAAAGAVAEAVGGLGQVISRQAGAAIQRQRDADDAAFVTERTNKLLRQETELLAEAETTGSDVDLENLQPNYQSRVEALSGGAPSPEALAEFNLQADNAFTRKFFPSYSRHQSGLNVQKRVSSTTTALDDISSEVLTGRTAVPEAVARMNAAITGLQETAGGVVDIDKLRQRGLSSIGVNAITAKINSGLGQEVIDEIQEGKWDQFTTTSELSALQRQAIKAVSEAESRQQAQTDSKNAVIASDLEINIFRNEATYRDVDNAMDAGIITPSKRTQLYKQLDNNAEEAAKAANNLTRVQTSIFMGIPLDPTSKEDREGVEQMWQSVLPDIDTQDPNAFANFAVSFIQSTGILPQSLKGSLSAFSRSGNPQQASQAADIIGRMQDVNSPALNDLTRESYAFGLSVQSLVLGGVDPTRAVEIARENAFGQTAQDKRTTSLILKGASSENVLFLNDKLDEFDPGIFSAQPEITPVMQAEFEVLLGEMVPFTNGNIDQARLMAWTSMRNVWGATTVNGGIQVMKYAPEAIYGKGGNTEWIATQFNDEMAAAGADPETTFIAVDTNTARTDQPSYPVFITRKDGMVAPMLDDNNIPLRWKPEFSSSSAYQELKKEQDERINRAKFKRGLQDVAVKRRQERHVRMERELEAIAKAREEQ